MSVGSLVLSIQTGRPGFVLPCHGFLLVLGILRKGKINQQALTEEALWVLFLKSWGSRVASCYAWV